VAERLEECTLYLPATRPALFAGVPLPVAGAFLVLAGFVIVILQNPLYEIVMVPLWFGARVVVSRDYNAVNVIYLYLLTAARGVDAAKWGGASVSPHPIRIPARRRGMI
jgi:type IV secretion system protein VirB3